MGQIKKILVIGAGESCIGIIKTIVEMGHEAIVFGTADNLPAKEFSSKYFVSSDYNLDYILNICRKIGIDGIVSTPVGTTLRIQARVADELGLRFISSKIAENFKDKFKMKNCFLRAGVLCAKGELVTTNQKKIKLSHICFPVIIKPIEGYASRGVAKANNSDELKQFLNEAMKIGNTHDILIEEFIGGKEFAVEGVCFENSVEIYAIDEKIRYPFPRTTEMGHILPPKLTSVEERQIVQTIQKAVIALGMNYGCFNAEIKIFNEQIYVIEINGRIAGDFTVSHLVEAATGQNMNKAIVNVALGKKPEVARRKYINHVMIHYFNLPSGRKIKKINSYDFIYSDCDLIWAKVFFKVGDLLPKVEHGGHRSGFVIVKSKSRESLLKKAKFYEQIIRKAIILE